MNEPFSSGNKITKRDGVIQAAEAMLTKLGSDDTVSLVCFDSKAYEEVCGVRASEASAALSSIRQHSGSTNFEEAFSVTEGLLSRLNHPSQRVIFLTDGKANAGSIETAQRLNQQIASQGVTVDCFGVGDDYNHNLMCEFVAVSNGEAQKLDTPEQAAGLFIKAVNNAQQALIRNAVLRLFVPEAMRDVEFYQITPQQHDHGTPEGTINNMRVFRVNLSSLTQMNIYNFVLRTSLDTPPAGGPANALLAKAVLEYDVPVMGLRSQKSECSMFASFSSHPHEEEVRTDVDELYFTATLERLDREVHKFAQIGDWGRVSGLLQEMCERAQQIRREDLYNQYQRDLKTLVSEGKLTQAQLNMNRKTTSQAQSQLGIKEASPGQVEGVSHEW